MPSETVTVAWINNPGVKKSDGGEYYNIKVGTGAPETWETIWGTQGKVAGLNKGDRIEMVTSIGRTGSKNLVTWKKAGNSTGTAVSKTYRKSVTRLLSWRS